MWALQGWLVTKIRYLYRSSSKSSNCTGSDAALKLVSITWGGPNKRAYEVRIAGEVVHESKDGVSFVPKNDILIENTRTLSITRDRNYLPDETKSLAVEVKIDICK